MKKIIKTPNEVIGAILKIIQFAGDIEESAELDTSRYNIKCEEAGYLIGQNGVHLQALEQIIKLILFKETGQWPTFILDVNSYRRDRYDFLRGLAQKSAEEVLATARPYFFRPMTAFERKIIHSAIVNYPSLTSLSEGQGRNRYVVVRLKEGASNDLSN